MAVDRHAIFVALASFPVTAWGQTKPFTSDLYSIDTSKLKAQNVKVEPAVYKGRKGIRVLYQGGEDGKSFALLPETEFQDGVIELNLSGDVAAGQTEGARGFTGLAFRSSPSGSSYECFYLRPTNGRAEDQERRNHSAQYISMPEFPWHRLREETPSKYESYVDLVPGEWTKVRIEVHGVKARLYV